MKKYNSSLDASKELGIKDDDIKNAIYKQYCIRASFYLSRSDTFKVPIKGRNYNPLIQRYKLKKFLDMGEQTDMQD